MTSRRCRPVSLVPGSAFKGFRFPPEIIVLAVRWYLQYGLSYRDLEELLAERGIEVDHVTVFRWLQCFTPALADAARPCRHAVGDRWFVDETYVKVAGTVALRLPGRRFAWPDHRRVRLGPTRHHVGASVLRDGAGCSW
jgi:IS6 family transposase